ncbi:hypothetical protein CU098_008349 [Rhizopus stolonifer]|uniref:Uncharacterized protein n=1 Tax=Rhizopus stolonifer TaxID=4846 RepID=A0A367J8Q0_RHIST|nr:hypothetical protein CU098_008349 [Rhizopus stolonifer]
MGRIVRHQPSENGQNGHAVKHTEALPNEKNKNQEHFVERVISIPLVKDSMSTAQAIANKSFVGRYALSTVNSTYHYALNNQPKYLQDCYQQYLQPHVEKANVLGCLSLDAIESKVPMITRPSSDIIQTVTPYHIIDGVKLKLNSTLQTVAHPAHIAIQSVNKQFGTIVVDNLEDVVDRYLPPSCDDKEQTSDNKSKKGNSENNQVKRAYGVLNEASRRISQKVSRSTAHLPKSRHDLAQLAESNPTVQNMFEQLKLIQETLVHSVTVYTNAAQDRLPASATSRVRSTIEYVNQVMSMVQNQVVQLTEKLKVQSAETPEWVKQKINALLELTNKQIALILNEFARTDISHVDKFKLVTAHIQDQVVPLLENLSSYVLLLKDKAQGHLSMHQKIKTQ